MVSASFKKVGETRTLIAHRYCSNNATSGLTRAARRASGATPCRRTRPTNSANLTGINDRVIEQGRAVAYLTEHNRSRSSGTLGLTLRLRGR